MAHTHIWMYMNVYIDIKRVFKQKREIYKYIYTHICIYVYPPTPSGCRACESFLWIDTKIIISLYVIFILCKYPKIVYSYQKYCAYVLATDTPSCPKSQWVPGGSLVGLRWILVGSWLGHKDREIQENVTWENDTVPKSEKSTPWAPAAPILNDFG